jgi:hypothetical protein
MVPASVGRLAQPGRRPGVLERHGHRPVLGHQRVRPRLGLQQPLARHPLGAQVERRHVGAEVHAQRLVPEQVGEDGREEVLAGVLLHVVEPPRGVDRARHRVADRRRQRRGQQVGDAVVLVHHVDDRHAAQGAEVVRLATRGRVERRPVQIDAPPVVGQVGDAGGEVVQRAVGVVEALRHADSIAGRRGSVRAWLR